MAQTESQKTISRKKSGNVKIKKKKLVKEFMEHKQSRRKNLTLGCDWRDLVTNPPTTDAVLMEDFESVKKRWDQVQISKKAGMSNLYIKMRNELRNSLFRDGKMINYSTEALYFLHSERYILYNRKKRNKTLTQVTCKICQKRLTCKEHEHMRVSHGPEYQYHCPACNVIKFSHVKELIAHYRVSHWEDIPLRCNQCSEVAYSPKELQHHILSHTSVSKITCRHCRFRFVSKDALHEHEAKEHDYSKPEVIQPRVSWTCELCGKIFNCKAAYLKTSMQTHKINLHHEKLHKCSNCGKTFSQANRLTTHIERCVVPASVRRYTCVYEKCNKSFKTEQDLQSHFIYHKPPKYPCGKCGQPFFHLRYLRVHKCPLVKE